MSEAMKDPEGRTKIEQLEYLLDKEKGWDDIEIEILPNGEIRQVGNHTQGELKPGVKPLTFRENLGGEYAIREEYIQ
jgi:hypothetical protein